MTTRKYQRPKKATGFGTAGRMGTDHPCTHPECPNPGRLYTPTPTGRAWHCHDHAPQTNHMNCTHSLAPTGTCAYCGQPT